MNFAIFGFPVRIHPYFWLLAVFLGFGAAAGGDMRQAMLRLAVWTVALLISILIHELGHAIVMRRFGFSPWITLHMAGGLASYDTGGTYGTRLPDTRGQILISAAGPGAGFILAAGIVALMFLTGHQVAFYFGQGFGVGIDIDEVGSRIVTDFIYFTLYISIAWGLLNLLPIYPLDGGHISREIMLRIAPRTGIRNSLVISMWTAGIISFLSLMQWLQARQSSPDSFSFPFMALMFGYLAYSSHTTLRGYNGGRSW